MLRINQLIHGLGTASRRQISYLPTPESRVIPCMLQGYGILSPPRNSWLFGGCTKNWDSTLWRFTALFTTVGRAVQWEPDGEYI
jgi:hypothetical protein